MNASTKTRSALRAALKQEDASITERLREDTQAVVGEPLENAPATAASQPAAETKAPVAAPAEAVNPTKVGKAKAVAAETANTRPAAKSRTAKPTAKATPATADAANAAATVTPSVQAKGKGTKKVGGAAAKAAATATTTKAGATPVLVEVADGKKDKGEKVVRDSFSIPASEHRRIKALREQAGRAGRLASKSEVLRAGLFLLGERSGEELVALLEGMPPVMKGKRSKKH